MKKHLFKKLVVPAVMAVVTAFSFTGCIGDAPSDTFDPNALTIMGKKSDMEKTYMSKIFDKYKRDTGNNINVIEYEDSEFEVKASQKFTEGEIPDLFMHFNNADLSRFNVKENFCFLDGESWAEDITDSAKAYCKDKEGHLIGLPFWESSVSGCYYNKKILKEYGGIEAASTQKQFDVLCRDLKASGYTPICWAAGGCSWMYQFGLDPIFADDPELLEKLNNNETSYAEIPAVREMVEWIKGAADKGWFGENYLNQGWDDVSEALSSGKAVMTFIWDTWFYTDFKPDKYTVDDFALMPIFMNTVDGGTYEGGNLNMMMVNKNSDKLEEALDFLEFCATPENYNYAFEGISTVSTFKNQTSNIQSKMVTDAHASISEKERVSTAVTKIVGYSAQDMADIFNRLFKNEIDVDECLRLMDEYRIAEAQEQGL